MVVVFQINLMSGAYRSCHGLDDFVPRELLVVPYGRPDGELYTQESAHVFA